MLFAVAIHQSPGNFMQVVPSVIMLNDQFLFLVLLFFVLATPPF